MDNKRKEMDNLLVFEMRCLRTILGVTRRDKLRNDEIRQRLGITTTIRDAVVSQRLRWFGHVVGSDGRTWINASYRQDFTGSRRRGRPLKRWADNIREVTSLPLRTLERKAMDRDTWRMNFVHAGARGPRVLCQ